MKFLPSLLWPLRVWQVLSMAPFGVAKKPLLPVTNTNLQFYAIICLVIHSISAILSVVFSSVYIDWANDAITNYHDVMSVAIVRLAPCIIVGEAIFKLNKQTDFLQQIIRIDYILRRKLQIEIDYKKYQFYNNILTTVWILISFLCVVCVYIVLHILGDSYTERFWLIYAIPSLLIYSLHYQRMVLYVYVIRRRYQMLNQFIEKACMFQERGIVNAEILQAFKQMSKVTFTEFPKLISETQLRDLRNAYQMLYDTTILFNDMFRWSIPLCICIDFHRLLVNAFYIFAVWLLQSYWLLIFVAIAWGSTNIVHLVMFSHACHSTNKEVKLELDSFLVI